MTLAQRWEARLRDAENARIGAHRLWLESGRGERGAVLWRDYQRACERLMALRIQAEVELNPPPRPPAKGWDA